MTRRLVSRSDRAERGTAGAPLDSIAVRYTAWSRMREHTNARTHQRGGPNGKVAGGAEEGVEDGRQRGRVQAVHGRQRGHQGELRAGTKAGEVCC